MPAPDRRPAAWLDALTDDDWQFVRRFLLASGSLKEVAAGYGISYPTVRARLDKLIAQVKAAEAAAGADAFERKLRVLVAAGTVAAGPARELLAAHQAARKETPS